MSTVLIVGGGLSGAAAARELADSGRQVLIIEASGALGGKARGYGCKATDKCANCGVCLTRNLWEYVENSSMVDVRLYTRLVDLAGEKGNYTAALKNAASINYISDISDVVVATGFNQTTKENFNGFVEIEGGSESAKGPVITGSDIERIMKERGETSLFEKAPEKVAFIQCYGSRDIKESAMYCSRVCCAYSTRAAKVIKKYYPECEITFFYMEMQQVKSGDYLDELKGLGINFIKCRPVSVSVGERACVAFDNPETGKREEQAFDFVVLSDGIRPGEDAGRIAEICGLGQTEAGFLRYVKDMGDADRTGIYIAGCAKGPYKIEETYADSVAVARRILFPKKSGKS